MMKSSFSDSQILAILTQADGGVAVPELCREHGMSCASFYKWRAGPWNNKRVYRIYRVPELKAHYLFESIEEVQEYAPRWLGTYNFERPNMALRGITPQQKPAAMA